MKKALITYELIAQKANNTISDVLEALQQSSINTSLTATSEYENVVIMLDFPVTNLRHKVEIENEFVGYADAGKRLMNLDHHFDLPELRSFVSTANLVRRFIKSEMQIERLHLVINHTDTDSIASIGIFLMPDHAEQLVRAAIAADHTGEENLIADALNSIEQKRDLAYSLEVLVHILETGRIPDAIRSDYERRIGQRARLQAIIKANQYESPLPEIVVIESDTRIDGALLVGLPELQSKHLIVIVSPLQEGRHEFKLRLGIAGIKDGLNLKQYDLPGFGGRWNAGSNKRSGGWGDTVSSYVDKIVQQYRLERSL